MSLIRRLIAVLALALSCTGLAVVSEVTEATPAGAQNSCWNTDFWVQGGMAGSAWLVHIRCPEYSGGYNHIWGEFHYYGVNRWQEGAFDYWVPGYMLPTAIFHGNNNGYPGRLILCANGAINGICWNNWNLVNLPHEYPYGWEIWRVDTGGWNPQWYYTVEGQSNSWGHAGTWDQNPGPESFTDMW